MFSLSMIKWRVSLLNILLDEQTSSSNDYDCFIRYLLQSNALQQFMNGYNFHDSIYLVLA